jgi:hypothetical protein
MEPRLRQAAQAEAQSPSWDNLPPPGEHLERVRINPQTGEKSIEYFVRESFIKQMNRPGQRIMRVMNPNTGQVLFGPPFERMPGR